MVSAESSIHAPQPELTELPAQVAAVVRIDGPADALSRLLGEAFDLSATAITASGAAFAGPPFARYLSMGEEVTAEAGFPFTGELVASDRVYRTELPGGRVVKATHVGPYDTLHETWAATSTWLEEQALVPSGTPWESYLTEPDVIRAVTEIIFPVT